MSAAKILVAQGGGPTAVINQSMVGVVLGLGGLSVAVAWTRLGR